MNNSENIEKQVQDAISSLDGLQRASAPPFLFTRIQARMERRQQESRGFFSMASRPVFILATMLLVILINLTVFLDTPARTSTAGNIVQDEDQLFAKEYFSDPSEGGFLVTNNDQP